MHVRVGMVVFLESALSGIAAVEVPIHRFPCALDAMKRIVHEGEDLSIF